MSGFKKSSMMCIGRLCCAFLTLTSVLLLDISAMAQGCFLITEGDTITGEIDDDNIDRINFYFRELSDSMEIQLRIPDLSTNDELEYECCISSLDGLKKQCLNKYVIDGYISLDNFRFKNIMGRYRALELRIDQIAPVYFVFIWKK